MLNATTIIITQCTLYISLFLELMLNVLKYFEDFSPKCSYEALPEKPVQNLEMGVSRLASYSVGRVVVGSDVKCHN